MAQNLFVKSEITATSSDSKTLISSALYKEGWDVEYQCGILTWNIRPSEVVSSGTANSFKNHALGQTLHRKSTDVRVNLKQIIDAAHNSRAHEQSLACVVDPTICLTIIIIIISIKKGWQCKARRERITSLSVRRPQPHNTNP